jgi:hypothetical protein
VVAGLASANGSYLTCASSSYTPDFVPQWTSCDVFFAGAAAALHLPLVGNWLQFSPDGNSILAGCDLYRAEGLVAHACDLTSNTGVLIFSADSSKLFAFGASRIQITPTAGGASVFLDRPCQIPNGYLGGGGVSADGSRLTDSCNQTIFEASTAAGSAFTSVVTDTLRSDAADDRSASFSPDSRVLQVPSGGKGIVLSVDGTPRQVLMNGQPLYNNSVVFEPAGGHNRAIFFTDDRFFAIGNQDGSGDWVNVPGFNWSYPRWSGHSVLSWMMTPGTDYPNPRFDISVVTGTLQPLVSNVVEGVQNQPYLTNSTLWFMPDGGGVYKIAIPQP